MREAVGNGVRHEGVLYRKLYDYTGKVTYVLGEFYWQLTRHQLTHNSDYQGTGSAAQKRLNRERTDSGETREIVWSAGETLTADAVLKAFRLAPTAAAALQRDALPTFSGASLLAKIFFWGSLSSSCDAVPLRRRRRRQRRRGDERPAQQLRRGFAGYRSCLNATAERHLGRRRSFGGFALAAATSSGAASFIIVHSQGGLMAGSNGSSPASSARCCTRDRVLVFLVCFGIVDKLTPYRLWNQIVDEKNVALAIVVGSIAISIG